MDSRIRSHPVRRKRYIFARKRREQIKQFIKCRILPLVILFVIGVVVGRFLC